MCEETTRRFSVMTLKKAYLWVNVLFTSVPPLSSPTSVQINSRILASCVFSRNLTRATRRACFSKVCLRSLPLRETLAVGDIFSRDRAPTSAEYNFSSVRYLGKRRRPQTCRRGQEFLALGSAHRNAAICSSSALQDATAWPVNDRR